MPEYTTITHVTNHGTIVAVHLADGPRPIYFDHRPFHHLWLARGENLANIIGARVRRVQCNEPGPDDDCGFALGESIVFEDEEEFDEAD